MLIDFQTSFWTAKTSVSWRVRVGSRVAGVLVGLASIIVLLLMEPPSSLPEPAIIQSIAAATLEIEKPPVPIRDVPKAEIEPPLPMSPLPAPTTPTKPTSQKAAARPSIVSRAQPSPVQDRPTPRVVPSQSGAAASKSSNERSVVTPRIATAPSVSIATSPTPGQGPVGQGLPKQLSAGALRTLRAFECAQIDVRDRPNDCPPNDELLKMLAKERGPQYRGENADAFSRNEQRWRGIPPPCLPNGQNASISGASACIRVGNVPSRVRTIKEICEARGLGGCAPTPSQASVNAAVEQVRRQQEAALKKAH